MPAPVDAKAECGRPASEFADINAVAAHWVEAHGDYLFNFAIGQLRDSNVAEDLVQDTFLAALRSQNSFSGRSSERTWLVGILRHKITDHLRVTCRERALRVEPTPTRDDDAAFDESLLWIHQVAAESASPSRRLELAEFREHLEKAMGKLPPRIAQVFQLYSIDERPNREVCAQLDISESNLWVMLHRARQLLRAELHTLFGIIKRPKLVVERTRQALGVLRRVPKTLLVAPLATVA